MERQRDAEALGPSPRVRGSRRHSDACLPGRGSIPACAGKPIGSAGVPPMTRVHPRVCGEARTERAARDAALGPSPRVRGSPGQRIFFPGGDGSIPACAGKPAFTSRTSALSRVHPRVCGEATMPGAAGDRVQGPSPRVRGSPSKASMPSIRTRSIPACAGKPAREQRGPAAVQVHPRVCGEALERARQRRERLGPSPRVRGSRYPRRRTP